MRPRTRRAARIVRRLAALALSDLEGFGDRLERHSGRAVHLESAVLLPDAPSGVCLRTAGADYLYYEKQTSPFHQAHILVGMAAHLLTETPGAGVDPRLVPDVSPRLARLILGDTERRPLTQDQAEALTFRALRRAGAAACPARLARWFLQQLSPLHVALLDAVPEAAARPCAVGRPDAGLRLYRQVIEIRDAMLALRPYRDPRVVSAAEVAARAAGLGTDALAASVEATVLAAAVAAKSAGSAEFAQPGEVWQPAAISADLRGEAAWLAKVSRAFARPLPLDQPRSIALLDGSPHAGELVRGRRPGRFRSGSRLDGHLAPREARQLRRREDWRGRS